MPQWFRFYNEAIDDRKLKHIARDSGQALVTVIGAWSVLMALANNDHDRGYLLLTADTAYDRMDLVDELSNGLDREAAKRLLSEFEEMGMIGIDTEAAAYYLPAFSKRQYDSDNSTKRVRQFRKRQKAALQNGDSNADETLQERDCNGPETETETEQNRDRKEKRGGKNTPPPPKPVGKKRTPRTKDPPPAAITRYRTATHLYPEKSLWDGIVEVVGATDDDLDRWQKVCMAWVAMGWNKRNVKGMLQHYAENRIPGDDAPKSHGNSGQMAAADAVRQWVEKEGIEWQAADV